MAASAMMMLTQLPAAAAVTFSVWGPTTSAAGLLMWLLPDALGTSMAETVQVRFACVSRKSNADVTSTLLGSPLVHDVCCSCHLCNDYNWWCSDGHSVQQAFAFTHATARCPLLHLTGQIRRGFTNWLSNLVTHRQPMRGKSVTAHLTSTSCLCTALFVSL